MAGFQKLPSETCSPPVLGFLLVRQCAAGCAHSAAQLARACGRSESLPQQRAITIHQDSCPLKVRKGRQMSVYQYVPGLLNHFILLF